jgi:Ni/Co efflux regulator RcnB
MKKSTILAAAIAAAMLGAPAFAKDHGKGKGHDKQDEKAEHREEAREVRQGAYFDAHHREQVRHYYVEHYGGRKGCPPGLAKKNNGCMPPGQARKWAVGEPVPRNVVVYDVPRPVLTYLPPVPVGYRYERVGGDLVMIRVSDRVVVDIMVDLF